MSSKYSTGADIDDHTVAQRGAVRDGRVRTYYQCISCGETAESKTGFRAFDCESEGSN